MEIHSPENHNVITLHSFDIFKQIPIPSVSLGMLWAESQETFTLVSAFAFMNPGKSFLLGV